MPTTRRQAMTTLYLEWRIQPNQTEDEAREVALASVRERINSVCEQWLKPVLITEDVECAMAIATDTDGEWLFTEEGDLPDDEEETA